MMELSDKITDLRILKTRKYSEIIIDLVKDVVEKSSKDIVKDSGLVISSFFKVYGAIKDASRAEDEIIMSLKEIIKKTINKIGSQAIKDRINQINENN